MGEGEPEVGRGWERGPGLDVAREKADEKRNAREVHDCWRSYDC